MDITVRDQKFHFYGQVTPEVSEEISLYGFGRRYLKKTGKTHFWGTLSLYNHETLKALFPKANHSYPSAPFEAERKRIDQAQLFRGMPTQALTARLKQAGMKFLYPPMKHQVTGLAFAIALKKSGLFYDPGLGKTYIGVVMAEFLIKKGLIKKCLVVCPQDLIRYAWMVDIEKFTKLRAVDARTNGFADQSADIYLINPEGIRKEGERGKVVPLDQFQMLFFDESSLIKNPRAQITRWTIDAANAMSYVVLASGTPAPNTMTEYWGQMMALGGHLGDSHGRMRDRFYFQKPRRSEFLWFEKTGAKQAIKKMISPFTLWATREECLDLPPFTLNTVELKMTKNQKDHYKEIAEEYLTVINGTVIEAGTELVVRQKLLQILNGFAIQTDQGDPNKSITVPVNKKVNPKLDRLEHDVARILAHPGTYIIIWGVYRNDIKEAYRRLSRHFKGTWIMGNMSKKQFNENMDSWTKDDTCRFIVTNPKSVKFGHTWNKAAFTIRYSATESFEDEFQSSARNYRAGQDKPVTELRYVMAGTIEKKVYKALRKKQALKDFFATRGSSGKGYMVTNQ